PRLAPFPTRRSSDLLELPAHVTPLVVVAVGRRGQTPALPEPFASREDAARERRPLTDLLIPTESARAPVAACRAPTRPSGDRHRSEEHTSELQSLAY